ncbi:MAG: glycosyltransferase 87 family protein [Candidatus Methylomirabilales bacterium]
MSAVDVLPTRWAGRVRDPRLPRWLIGGGLVALALVGLVFAFHGRGGDMRVYLTAAGRFAEGSALYRENDADFPFKYLPPAVLLFFPLSFLPVRLAMALWNLGSVGLMAWLVVRTRCFVEDVGGLVTTPAGARDWAPVVALLAVVLPVHRVLMLGQVDVLIVALTFGASVWPERERRGWDVAAAAAGTLAALMKPPAALVGLVWLSGRRWRVIGWCLPAMLVLWAPILGRYGWDATLELVAAWLAVLEKTTLPRLLEHNTQGLPTLLLLGFEHPSEVPTARAMWMGQLAALAAFLLLIIVRRPRRWELVMLVCFATAFLSPLAWRANFVAAYPLVYASLVTPDVPVRRGAWALAALLVLNGLVVSADLLGWERERRVLYFMRPYAVLYGVLLLWVTVGARLTMRQRSVQV